MIWSGYGYGYVEVHVSFFLGGGGAKKGGWALDYLGVSTKSSTAQHSTAIL